MKNEIYIGDNLKVMKHPSFKKYINKIKMIYIDPPYNTHYDKSYNDKITTDEWISFMRDRLEVSKAFLKDDGVIFISIDDNEYANLKILVSSIFKEENFVGTFITKQAQRSNAKHINIVHEYILCFAKNKAKLPKFSIKRMQIPEQKKMIDSLNKKVKKIIKEEGVETANKKIKDIIKEYCHKFNISWLKNYSNVDNDGNIYFSTDLSTPGTPRRVNIPQINLKLEPLKTRGWSTDQKFIKLYNENRLCFKDKRPYCKHYLYEAEDNIASVLNFFSRQGTNDLKKLGLDGLFDTPKPVEMLKFLIRICTKENDIILDYFAGSGSLAQAVYEVNDEDLKNNKYVLIQKEEEINKKSDVYKTCKEFKIKPSVDYILRFRIETFLKNNNKEIDFDYFKID